MSQTQANFAQPPSLVKYSNPVLVSTAGKKQNKVTMPLIQDKPNQQNIASTYTEDILNTILPPREYTTEKQQLWLIARYLGSSQYPPPPPPSRMSWTSNKNLTNGCSSVKPAKQASAPLESNCTPSASTNSSGRSRLTAQRGDCCWCESATRLDRYSAYNTQTIQSYQALYESSIAFGMRRALQAEQKRKDMENKISALKSQTKELDDQVNDLETKISEMEAADKEQQEADKQTHKNNIEAQKRTNQILKEELEKLLQGPQQAKK